MMQRQQAEDALYIQQYGAAVLWRAWHAGEQRHAQRYARQSSQGPISEVIHVHSVKEALRDLFMAGAGYYLAQTTPDEAMPEKVSAQLLAMHRALRGDGDRIAVLNNALAFFVHSAASFESQDVRNAIKAAQLTLKALQDSYAEMPVVSSPLPREHWIYD